MPLVRLTVPSVLSPSVNVTVPVGGPPVPVTVALSTTCWPNVEETGFTVREVWVGVEVPLIVTVTGFELLGLKVELPLYAATIR